MEAGANQKVNAKSPQYTASTRCSRQEAYVVPGLVRGFRGIAKVAHEKNSAVPARAANDCEAHAAPMRMGPWS